MRIGPVLAGKSLAVKAATLALSVSAHAAVALIAAHGGSSLESAAPPGSPRAELPAPELAIVEAPSVDDSSSKPVGEPAPHRANHTHPYPVAADHDVTPHDPSLPHIPLPGATSDRLPAPPPAVALEPSIAPARFVLTIGRTTGAPSGGAAAEPSSAAAEGAATFAERTVDSPATLLSGIAPAYTREAEIAGVETAVPLEIVVDNRGNVSAVRALEHVGYGLDEVALRSIRGYRFEPARRAGHPVAVRMRWLVRFELR